MQPKHIHFIINPAAGREEPILSFINNTFKDTDIKWDISITKEDGDAKKMALECLNKTDIVAIYGGDGSIMEVAQALYQNKKPMAIIPGGTANVMAKELGIPIDTKEAIELLTSKNFIIQHMDMGLINNKPFVIRVNFGILSDMVLEAGREMKNTYGQLAYGITTLQTVSKADPQTFKINIDGEEIIESGVALTVTNLGNIGVEGFSFLPDISFSDGMFDIILLNEVDILSILRVAGSTLLQQESSVLKRWKGREITIELEKTQKFICDDCVMEADKINIKVVPDALQVIVPGKIES